MTVRPSPTQTHTSAPAIQARDVTKRYGDFSALAGVDLRVERGEVFALLGPNGAGKTTFVEILEGFRNRTDGDVSVLGFDPAQHAAALKSRVGIVLQQQVALDVLSVEEALRHFASLYPAPLNVDDVIAMVGLQEKRRARMKTLSGGQLRRVDLALAVIGDPDLIFLDEPTTGFDPAARHQAWDVIRNLTALGKTVLLTTHYLDEAEQLANRVGVIARGRILEVATPSELGGRASELVRVSCTVVGALTTAARPQLRGEVAEHDGLLEVLTDTPTAVVHELSAWAAAHGYAEVPRLSVTRPSLEEIYLRMIATADEAAAASGEAR